MVVVQGAMSARRCRMTASRDSTTTGRRLSRSIRITTSPREQEVRHEAVAARRKEAKFPFVWLVERMFRVVRRVADVYFGSGMTGQERRERLID